MADADPFSVYLQLAEKVFKREVKLNALSAYIPSLPALDRELLDRLAEESEKASLSQPRMSWAICCVAEKASRQQKLGLFTRSLAAWYLGRAANRWVQPQKIAKAIARARRGFVILGDAGWVAACDWMANDLPWVSENLMETEKKLNKTLFEINNTNCDKFLPHIFLALAQTQILLEKLVDADANISNSEKIFFEKGDYLNQARCWIVKANCLRRESKFSSANDYIRKSERIFNTYSSIQDLGKLNYYKGIISLFSSTDFVSISNNFNIAINIFSKTNVNLWKGMSLTFLGTAYMQIGELAYAATLFSKADLILNIFRGSSVIAQNYTAFGKLYFLLGFFKHCIFQLEKAKLINETIGRKLEAEIDAITIAEAYFQQNRYQDALHIYESAFDELNNHEDKVKLGLLQLKIANYWISLNDYSYADKQLDIAEPLLVISNQLDSLIKLNNIRAQIQFELKHFNKAQKYLMDSLELAISNNLLPQIALTEFNLGNLMLARNDPSKAIFFLKSALIKYEIMNMKFELASCKNSIALCLEKLKQKNAAMKLFNEVLDISSGSFKELEWRAYWGLANLVPADLQINYYKLGTQALQNIRINLLQPSLASAYGLKPKSFIQNSVTLAYSQEKTEDLLTFIEAEKANSLVQQLNSATTLTINKDFPELQELISEINRIKSQINTLNNNIYSLKSAIENQKLQKILNDFSDQYHKKLSRLERKYLTSNNQNPSKYFSLNSFVENANSHFNQKWLAFEYYVLNDLIILVIVTPYECLLRSIPLSSRLIQLLKINTQFKQDTSHVSKDDLIQLGEILIPNDVLQKYSSDTNLIIIPHQQLHGIPWAAIGKQPVVQKCIPIIVPSLTSLQLLWKRLVQNNEKKHSRGLMIGISEFEERYPSLPFVQNEIESIKSIFNESVDQLTETQVTYDKLMEVFQNKPMQNKYQWLHLATHFFIDQNTGRIGGFALQNEDIWLDKLRDLSYLPPIIILSGCSSLYSQIFNCDEQISIASTCFMSGVNTVIGSVWPIRDNSTISFISDFYIALKKQKSPSHSLAIAQRKAINSSEDISTWCSYLCMGIE